MGLILQNNDDVCSVSQIPGTENADGGWNRLGGACFGDKVSHSSPGRYLYRDGCRGTSTLFLSLSFKNLRTRIGSLVMVSVRQPPQSATPPH